MNETEDTGQRVYSTSLLLALARSWRLMVLLAPHLQHERVCVNNGCRPCPRPRRRRKLISNCAAPLRSN